MQVTAVVGIALLLLRPRAQRTRQRLAVHQIAIGRRLQVDGEELPAEVAQLVRVAAHLGERLDEAADEGLEGRLMQRARGGGMGRGQV